MPKTARVRVYACFHIGNEKNRLVSFPLHVIGVRFNSACAFKDSHMHIHAEGLPLQCCSFLHMSSYCIVGHIGGLVPFIFGQQRGLVHAKDDALITDLLSVS